MADRPTDMDEFLTQPNMARVATTNKDGSPHCVPLWYKFNPGDGTFEISTGAESVTVKNLRRNPVVSVVVDDQNPPYKGVAAEGIAEVSEPKGKDHEYFTPNIIHYLGEGAVEGYLKGGPGQKERVRIKVKPKRWKFWDASVPKMGSVKLD
ncbi:MAG: TIGR03618 family F420-dependent PPOX class oxidoreductase [bacterium]